MVGVEAVKDILSRCVTELHSMSILEAVAGAKGKKDTIGVDARLEKLIIKALSSPNSVLVTEESGVLPSEENSVFPSAERTAIIYDELNQEWYFIDPFDMSKPFKTILESYLYDDYDNRENLTVGQGLKALKDRKREHSLDFAIASITKVTEDKTRFNVMVNVENGELYYATHKGMRRHVHGEDGPRVIRPRMPGKGVIATTVIEKPYPAYIDNLPLGLAVVHVEPGPHRVLFATELYNGKPIAGNIISGFAYNGEKLTEQGGLPIWMIAGLEEFYEMVRWISGKPDILYKGALMNPSNSLITSSGINIGGYNINNSLKN